MSGLKIKILQKLSLKKKLKKKNWVAFYGTPINKSGKYIQLRLSTGNSRWFDSEKDFLCWEEYCCYWNKYYMELNIFMELFRYEQ